MASKAVIRLNDLTDHGGKVITAINNYVYQGVPVATKGDLVSCPKCKGVFPIVEGSDDLKHQGKPVALEGMHVDNRTTPHKGAGSSGQTSGNGESHFKTDGCVDERDARQIYTRITQLSDDWPVRSFVSY